MNSEQKILHKKFLFYGTNAKEWMRKCVLLLPQIEEQRIWEQKGFGSIYEYAAKLAGMNRDTVNEALRILNKIADKPELQKVVAEKGIHAIRPVATIATPETAAFWAEKAMLMSKNTLETYVSEMKKSDQISSLTIDHPNSEAGRPRTANELEIPQQEAVFEKIFDQMSNNNLTQITINLSPETLQTLKKLKGQNTWDDLFQQLLSIREEKLHTMAKEAEEKFEQLETSEKSTRHIPAKIKKYVIARTNGTCSYPNCTKPYQILHHTNRFALNPTHPPETIQPLCKDHERLAHLGLIKNEEHTPSLWKIQTAPDTQTEKYQVDQMVQKYRNFK